MQRSLLSILTATSIALSTTGCATLLAGGESRVSVEVDGPAEPTTIVTGVINDHRVVKEEPRFSVVLDRGSAYAIAMSADGYEPDMVIVKSEVTPAYWLNLAPITLAAVYAVTAAPTPEQGASAILIGELVGLGGMLVDAFSKNALRHNTQEVKLRLRRAEKAEAAE